MPKPETYRTFIALPLSEAVTRQLGDVEAVLRRACPERAVRWVPPERVHLTLFFLGDVLVDRLEPTQRAIAVVARNIPPFSFAVQGLGAFPNTKRPRVVWVGVEDASGRLALLHDALNEAMEAIGFAPDTRPFSPHLTLGRVRRRTARRDVRRVGEAVVQAEVGHLGDVPAEELIFFRSVLKPTGAEYTPLARFPLGA
jgi:2'-5' RNA ligase